MFKYRYRLIKCFFLIINKFFSFAYLNEIYQRLKRTLANAIDVFIVSNLEVKRNVMSLQYAINHNFHIKSKLKNRN